MKICKDCKWCEPDAIPRFARCAKPFGTSLVTGEPGRHRWSFCEMQREDGWFFAWQENSCGKRGRYWEAK